MSDVNVTEKVARVIASDTDEPMWSAVVVARNALAALADPEVLAGIAGVLREHGCKWSGDNVLSCLCDKGWHGGAREQRIAQHADHQAAAVVEWLRRKG